MILFSMSITITNHFHDLIFDRILVILYDAGRVDTGTELWSIVVYVEDSDGGYRCGGPAGDTFISHIYFHLQTSLTINIIAFWWKSRFLFISGETGG